MKRFAYIGISVVAIAIIIALISGDKYSKSDTVRYHSECMTIMEEANEKAKSRWTIIGAVSDMTAGFNQVMTLAPNGKVDPVVTMKMHHWAKSGKVYFDEMDAEVAAIFKGALVGFALGLDFGGVTWGGSSLAAYGILETDNTKEESAKSDHLRAALELRQYMYEHSYFE